MRTYFLSILILSLCLFSCKSKKNMSDAPDAASTISFTDISKAAFSGLDTEENILINNASDWAEFWSRANSNQSPTPERPDINFSVHSVLAACMGTKNSGGYSIEIADTKIAGETVYASVVKSSPGQGCMTTMAITYPYHVIQIEKGNIKKAVFNVEERVDDCK
ncbi:MAG: protease complex subunit PrcB family protein [Bacteroidia bacterium]|nr:protease complex subunit PrcB family protein [Bacteroidia bacterium]